MTDQSATSVLAAKLAEGLGWGKAYDDRDGTVYAADELGMNSGELWVYHPLGSVEIDAPSSKPYYFSLDVRFVDSVIVAKPYFTSRHRWTDEARDFVRRINALTDGLIVYALHNNNQDDCLTWLGEAHREGEEGDITTS